MQPASRCTRSSDSARSDTSARSAGSSTDGWTSGTGSCFSGRARSEPARPARAGALEASRAGLPLVPDPCDERERGALPRQGRGALLLLGDQPVGLALVAFAEPHELGL